MAIKGFIEGGIASVIAGCSTHPLDLIKVRMQLQGEAATAAATTLTVTRPGPLSVGVRILRTDGLTALFSGVSATVLRQTLYSTTRMGLYDILKTKWSDPNTHSFPLPRKIAAGLLAGGIGAAVGNPADVAMVRMQADGRLPPSQRRNYKNAGDAIKTMVRTEGVGSLWRGSSLTVNRAMIVTAAQLATYDEVKERMIGGMGARDGMGTHLTASFVAGFVAAVASNPVDVIKTRVMNMKAGMYSGPLDCAVKTVRMEGVTALYKGFVPTVTRQGPFTVVLFVTLEQVRRLLRDF